MTDDVDAFLDDVNKGYPALDLSINDFLYCYGALTPGDDRGDSASLRSRTSATVDHRRTNNS